jgi:nucleotide-binding universal stress UspA family protein
MSDPRPTIIAVLPKDDHAGPVLDRAAELGREEGARVILYDVSATGNVLESPLPTEFASDGPDRGVPPLLTAQDLEAAGQGPLAESVRSLVAAGIDAYGWLPERSKAEDLVDYSNAVGATRVLVGAGTDPDPDEIRRAGLTTLESVPTTADGR